jgi:hypothetical protein
VFSVSNNQRIRPPKHLGVEGKKLYREISRVFSFADDPGRERILLDACAVADSIGELVEAMDGQELVVAGSMRQPVLNPLYSAALSARSQLSVLIGKLDLPPTDEELADKSERLSAVRRRVAKLRVVNH